MAVTNTHLVLAKKFLVALTWERIFKVFVVVVTAVALVLFWTFRHDFFQPEIVPNRLASIKKIDVSISVKNEIDSVVRKSPIISGIKVITINFQRNIRTDSYVYIEDPVVQEVYTKELNSKVYETPLFTENKIINRNLLRLISGEFVCVPYNETLSFSITPYLENRLVHVCASAIPPYHGDFTGILAIYLSGVPTKDDTERLFLLSRDISLKIYEENKHGVKSNNK